MLKRLLRHVLFLIVAAALMGGTVSGAVPAAHAATGHAATAQAEMVAAMPCGMAMTDGKMADARMVGTKPGAPCKGMTKDCVDQMGCIAVTALPAPFLIHETAVRYSAVDYWVSLARLDSLDLVPEPLPPRTI
ncbi:MAG: hypothetical protein ABWY00_09075 [Dongiaceae bacterium]